MNLLKFPAKVKLVEMGPRDGLQNEPEIIPADIKIEFIDHLNQAGCPAIEVTSFVSPKWVPQLADHTEVFTKVKKLPGVTYPVLVPNMQGFEAAKNAGVKEISLFTAASNSFTQKNINCSIEESFERFTPVIAAAKNVDIKIRAYISCALACPYEGETPAKHVADIALRLHELGCHEISLGDTIGVGTPLKVQCMIHAVAQKVPMSHLAGHFHDTYGQALANIYAAMELGMSTFDSSVAGLGGCPYAKGASGNVASEDVVYMLHQMNIETGIDLNKLIDAGTFICRHLNKPSRSKVALAILAKQKDTHGK